MLPRLFRSVVVLGIVAVVVGVGWIVYGEFSKSEATHAAESFAMVNHQTGQMGQSLGGARTFISSEVQGGVSGLNDITALLGKWEPKYQKAQTGYRKFDSAIAIAEASAETYFATQRVFTDRYHDQQLRARAQEEDAAEFRHDEQWKVRAYGVREEARAVMDRLDDMDTTLQKIRLRSDFSFDVEALSRVPQDILALEAELSEFQVASENIRDIIGSPFDPIP